MWSLSLPCQPFRARHRHIVVQQWHGCPSSYPVTLDIVEDSRRTVKILSGVPTQAFHTDPTLQERG